MSEASSPARSRIPTFSFSMFHSYAKGSDSLDAVLEKPADVQFKTNSFVRGPQTSWSTPDSIWWLGYARRIQRHRQRASRGAHGGGPVRRQPYGRVRDPRASGSRPYPNGDDQQRGPACRRTGPVLRYGVPVGYRR